MLLGVARVLLIPFLMDLASFGYWQVYVLYCGLAGLFSFGYTDGIYLKYGDKNIDELPLKQIRASIVFYFLSLIISVVILALCIFNLDLGSQKLVALMWVLPNIAIICVVGYFSIIFQVTNQIVSYSKYLIIDKLLFFIGLLLYVQFGEVEFIGLIYLDVASRAILLFVLIINYYQYLFGDKSNYFNGLDLYKVLSKSGIKLLLANFIGIIILTIARFFVEINFSLDEFAVFSFGMSLTSMFLMAVASISIVLYPSIKRLDIVGQKKQYTKINLYLFIITPCLLLIYFPAWYIVSNFIPLYGSVLDYLNLLFIFCVFQSKMQIQLNLFYKVLREETRLFYANIETLLVSIVFIIIAHYIFESLYSVVLSFVMAIVIRTFRSELFFNKRFDLSNRLVYFHGAVCVIFYLVTVFFMCS